MPTPPLLLRVAACWPVPGLGLLALAEDAAPELSRYELHTVLRIEAVQPDGNRLSGMGTVEEISRGEQAERGLLLDLGSVDMLAAGTEIRLIEAVPDLLL